MNRLIRLFSLMFKRARIVEVSAKAVTQAVQVQPQQEAKIPQRMTASVRQEDSGFRAGASVAFITPIGAYAGIRPQNDEIRKNAEKQFYAMDNTSNMTMN